MTTRSLAWALVIVLSVSTFSSADDTITLTPATIELTSTPCDGGWKRWDSIGNVNGVVAYRERLTALAAHESDVWVGTSHGRLLSRQDNQWTLQGTLKGIQITGIAFEGLDKVWLSTSDGIRRLERADEQTWKVTEFREYYEGHPSFVSGGYLPGEDAVRLWGYVDDIFIPQCETAYSPFVISTEHGFFCWGHYGGVWHHFMPHYWGANSAWLDTRELLPHRRPTCMIEDNDGHLWVGTQWDGIVRLNAHARKYHARKPEDNKKDGIEFSHIGATEVGRPFDTVLDLAASADHGVWAILTSTDGRSWLARFDGQRWETHALEAPARSVAEVHSGIVLIGVESPSPRSGSNGLRKVTWEGKKVERLAGPDGVIREIVRLPNGSVVAASWWDLYELDAAGKDGSP
ncbi:MAG: two-component regulator propeller domain-containing protein [Pirellulaceae bacterium]